MGGSAVGARTAKERREDEDSEEEGILTRRTRSTQRRNEHGEKSFVGKRREDGILEWGVSVGGRVVLDFGGLWVLGLVV